MGVRWSDGPYRFDEHRVSWRLRLILGAALTVLVLVISQRFDSDRVMNPPAAPAVTQQHQP